MKTGAAVITEPRSRFADFVALTKPRLNSLVVVTTGVGYLAGRVEAFDPVVFVRTSVEAEKWRLELLFAGEEGVETGEEVQACVPLGGT